MLKTKITRHGLIKANLVVSFIILVFYIFMVLLTWNRNEAPITIMETFSDVEHSMCVSNYGKYHRRAQAGQCPQSGIVTAMQGGRLGNMMWEYASVWAVARRTGLQPYLPRCFSLMLDPVFEALSVPSIEEIGHCPVDISTFVTNISSEWNYKENIFIPLYEFKYDWVLGLADDVVQEFSFKRRIVDKAQTVLRTAVSQLEYASPVFVGVHVRRTDYFSYLSQKYPGFVRPNLSFFFNAMQYFEKKFGNVQFVFVSDDADWCREHFAMKKNVYIASNYLNLPSLDLAILAACNHTIFDYGTFGQWAGILAGGETIYYNISSNRHFQSLENWYSYL